VSIYIYEYVLKKPSRTKYIYTCVQSYIYKYMYTYCVYICTCMYSKNLVCRCQVALNAYIYITVLFLHNVLFCNIGPAWVGAYIYICIYIYIYTYTCIYIYVYIYIYIYMYICIYIYIYVCVYTYRYIYIYM